MENEQSIELEPVSARAEDLPDEQARTRLVVRTGALLALLLTLLYTALFLSQRWWHPVLFNVAACIVLAVLSFVLHRRASNKSIAVFLTFLIAQLYLVTNLYLGKESGIHYFLFCIMPFLFIAFPRKKDLLFIVLIGVTDLAAFVVTEYEPHHSRYLIDPSPDLITLIHLGSTTGAIFLISGLVLVLYLDVNRAKNAFAREHRRSESLLLNVLPGPIASRLKVSSGSIAETFPEATVLFADIVGFTKLAAKKRPEKLVEILNSYFSGYDELAERYGVEKIKTIGDAYMVAAGIPQKRTDHAAALARMGADMIQATDRISRELGLDLAIRVGVHSGEVTAGVIGKKKFIYDLWGDTVNIASRMESHGVPGRVQVSAHTYALVKDELSFEHRGKIEVKGMGEQDVYLLKN